MPEVWEVSSRFPALSAHVLVVRDGPCHEIADTLKAMLQERFRIEHTTMQVDHEGSNLVQIVRDGRAGRDVALPPQH